MPSRNLASTGEVSNDILAIIFATLAILDPPRAANKAPGIPEHERKAHLGWISAIHVCSKWRAVGLAYCGVLWADIIATFPEGFATIAARVPPNTLVVLDLQATKNPEIRLSIAQPFLDRARIIKDCYSAGQLQEADSEEAFWKNHLPGRLLRSLEHLNLSYYHPSEIGGEFYSESLATLAPLNAPNLTHAALTTFIPLLAPRLRVLTAMMDWTVTVPEMAEYLGMHPALEELVLRLKIAPAPTAATAAWTPNVHLSRLRSFTNESDDFSIADLLHHVSFPATTKVDFYHGPMEEEPDVDVVEQGLHALCQAVSSQLKEASRNQMVIDHDSATHLSVVPRASSFEEEDISATEKGVTLGGGYELPFDSALAIVTAEVALNVTSLVIQAFRPDVISLDDLPGVHGALKNLVAVEELILRHRAQQICGIFEDDRPEALFPALQQIVLDFKASEYADDDTHDARWLDQLCNMLSTRRRENYPAVRSVILIGTRELCGAQATQCFVLTNQHIQKLRTLVGTVTDARV